MKLLWSASAIVEEDTGFGAITDADPEVWSSEGTNKNAFQLNKLCEISLLKCKNKKRSKVD